MFHLCRYNFQIKHHVADFNAIKKAKEFGSNMKSVIEQFYRAFCGDALIQREITGTVSPLDRVSRGAICVWQNCRNTWNRWCIHPDIRQQKLSILNGIGKALLEAVGKKNLENLVKQTFVLEMLYLNLQIQRLQQTADCEILELMLDRLYADTDTTNATAALISVLENANSELVENFDLRQRENIDDFIEHLESYYTASAQNFLNAEVFLLCEKG